MVIRPRQVFFAMLFTFAALGVSSANNVYLAQTAQGAGSGADCANALAVAYFNSSSNWSSTPTGTKIGPATTVHLCGTISTNLTFQGNGASGNPVILDGTNAAMNAYIYVGTQYWTIQNCTWATSFATNSASQAVIQTSHGANTAFGTIQNNHIDVQNSSQNIFLGYGSHDITIQNNYLRISTPPAGDGFDTDVLDSEGSYNVVVQGNYLESAIGSGDNPCTSCHDDIIQTWAASGSLSNYNYNWTIRYNEFVENSPGKNAYQEMLMLQNTNGVGHFDIYSNVFNCVAGANGGNGISAYGGTNGATYNIYNNTIIEHLGACNNLFNIQNDIYNLSNNIIYSSDNVTLLYAPSGTINRSTNLWYGSTNSPSCSGTTDICGQNPLFTNFAANDFSLQAASPAIGTGTNLGSSYNQYPMPGTAWPNPALGTRPSSGAWDIGAYDPSTGSAAAPPSGLTAIVN